MNGKYIFLKAWFNVKIVERGLLVLVFYLYFHKMK